MSALRLGITAFLTDEAAGPAELAREVEGRGYHSLFLPEHTHLPVAASEPPDLVDGVHLTDYRRSLDPFVSLAMAAAVTDRLRLGTGVVLAAQHDPIVLAKQVATLDHLSGGRVDLGIGFGWNRLEAADHGVDFTTRRAVAREHVECMRSLWTDEVAEFHGAHVDLPPCYSWPKPLQNPLPVLVGGGATPKVFAAVAEYGDGWLPVGGSGLGEAVPALRRAMEAAGRDPGSLRVVPFGTIPTEGKLEHYASLGIDEVVLRVPSGTRDTMWATLDSYDRFVTSVGSGHG